MSSLFGTGISMWRWNSRFPFEENAYYHIYNRWYNSQIIFHNRACFQRFYEYLIRYSNEYEKEIKIVSYAFLPNHFHFVVQNIGTGTNISMFMKKLQWAYAIWYKRVYGTGTGKSPFFEWRFKAKLIDTDEYLAQCMAYVNYNPLKHEVVKNIEDYPWTSYHQLENKNDIMWYKDMILSELEY